MYKVMIPAAGSGKRMKAGKNKQFLEIHSVPIIIHTLRVFDQDPWCEEIIVAINEKDEQQWAALMKQFPMNKPITFVQGGKERQESVYHGLQAIKKADVVLIHDGARPFVHLDKIHELVKEAEQSGAAVLAVPVKDTIKKAVDQKVIETVERSSLWAVQTPQAFRFPLAVKAHETASKEEFMGTDDASLVERLQHPVSIVEGDYFNIKITTPEDLVLAQAIYLHVNQDK